MVDKQFTNPESKYHLTPEELYMFLMLSLNQRIDYSIFTNINILEESMFIPYTKKSKKENRERIISNICKLKEKNIIVIEGELDIKNVNNMLYIRIIKDFYEDDMKETEKWYGFNKIFFNDIKDFDIDDIYIYCITKKFDKTDNKEELDGYFMCSFNTWSELLNKSLSTTKRKIENARKNGVIFINRGDYEENSRKKQNVNMYRTKPFEIYEKTNRTLEWEKEQRREELKKIPKAFGKERE